MDTSGILSFFAKYIESELGIVYSDTNSFQLQNRLEEIAKLVGAKNLVELHVRAQTGISASFRQHLLDVATNNETSFFRDPRLFVALEKTVFPELLCRNGGGPLRIWCAACSSGQEPLSIAMTLVELSKKVTKPIEFSVLATDISDRILARAKRASYSSLEVQRGLPETYLHQYFTKENDTWSASPSLTKYIEFKRLNLKDAFIHAQPFDIVFCRNVLIYQSVQSKTEILSRMTKTLRPEGILVLGAGESLLGISNDFEHVSGEGAVVYRRKRGLASAA